MHSFLQLTRNHSEWITENNYKKENKYILLTTELQFPFSLICKWRHKNSQYKERKCLLNNFHTKNRISVAINETLNSKRDRVIIEFKSNWGSRGTVVPEWLLVHRRTWRDTGLNPIWGDASVQQLFGDRMLPW